MIGFGTNEYKGCASLCRHTERSTRRSQGGFSAQIEHPKAQLSSSKNGWVVGFSCTREHHKIGLESFETASAFPSDYLKSVPMAVVSLDNQWKQ